MFRLCGSNFSPTNPVPRYQSEFFPVGLDKYIIGKPRALDSKLHSLTENIRSQRDHKRFMKILVYHLYKRERSTAFSTSNPKICDGNTSKTWYTLVVERRSKG